MPPAKDQQRQLKAAHSRVLSLQQGERASQRESGFGLVSVTFRRVQAARPHTVWRLRDFMIGHLNPTTEAEKE